MSLRDKILRSSDLPTEDVEVPEWNSTIRLTGLTSKEAEEFGAELGEHDGDLRGVRARLLVRSVTDPETNERVFTPEDADALQNKSHAVVQRLSEIVMRLTGLVGDEDTEGN